MDGPSILFSAILAGLAPSQATADADKGWVRPPSKDLRALFVTQYKRDLGEFELLKTNEEEWTRPYISKDADRLYVGTRSGWIQALDPGSGELLWQRRDMGTIGVGLTEFQDIVVAGSDSDIVALDRATGETRWKLPINGRIGGRISVSGNVAVAPVRPNAFVAVALETGKQLWRVQRQTPDGITVRGQATPTLDAQRKLAYLGFSDGTLVAVDLNDGGNKWIAQLGKRGEFFADVDATPVLINNGTVLMAASYNGGLARLNPDSGEVLFKKEELVHLTGLADGGDDILVASYGDGQVLGVYASNGKVRWRYRLDRGAPTEAVAIGDGRMMVASTEGPITILRASTGEPIQIIALSSGVSVPPFFRSTHIAAMTNTGLLLVFRRGS